MILEQAFHYLPEVFAGTYYPRQDYEGGVVSAFALAALQELNGRNAPNPLSLIQTERPYKNHPKSWSHYSDKSKKRYLRADMFLNLSPLRVSNSQLSTFGWRNKNWLEAKYFRAYDKETGLPVNNKNKNIHTGKLLADLIRLLSLPPLDVPEQRNGNKVGFMFKRSRSSGQLESKSPSGRYLLHVYSGAPKQHLLLSYKQKQKRPWLDALLTEGTWQVTDTSLLQEPASVSGEVAPDMDELEFDFTCTSFVISPYLGEYANQYTCILSRIDSFDLRVNNESWGIDSERSIVASDIKDAHGIYTRIQEYVGSRIGLKDNTEEDAPVTTHTSDIDDAAD